MGSLGTVVGPTLGGLVVTSIDWRWIFFINVPIGVATLAAALVLVPDLRPGSSHRFDIVGVLLSITALFAVTFGLIEGQRYDWGVVYAGVTIVELIAAGLVLFAVFIAWEWRHAEPLVPLALFRDRNFSVMNVIGIALSFGMQGVFLPTTIYLQSVLGLSALDAGLAIAPLTVGAMFAAPVSGRLADRIGGKYLLIAGLTAFAAGDAWLAYAVRASSTWRDLLGPFLLAGAGLGLVFAPLPTIALRRVVPAMAGAALGVLNTTRQLGFAMATGVIGAVLQSQLLGSLHDRAIASSAALPPSLREGFIAAFSNAGKAGLALGRGQVGAAQLPVGLPPALKAQLLSLAHDVFTNGYVAAMRPTLAVAVGVLLAAAAATLLVSVRPDRSGAQPRSDPVGSALPAQRLVVERTQRSS